MLVILGEIRPGNLSKKPHTLQKLVKGSISACFLHRLGLLNAMLGTAQMQSTNFANTVECTSSSRVVFLYLRISCLYLRARAFAHSHRVNGEVHDRNRRGLEIMTVSKLSKTLIRLSLAISLSACLNFNRASFNIAYSFEYQSRPAMEMEMPQC